MHPAMRYVVHCCYAWNRSSVRFAEAFGWSKGFSDGRQEHIPFASREGWNAAFQLGSMYSVTFRGAVK